MVLQLGGNRMDIKYNIYYSFSSSGPWTLANDIPIDHSDSVMEYFIDNLSPNTTYYIVIVGGYMDGSTFVQLKSQSIGPFNTGANAVGSGEDTTIKALTYSPQKIVEVALTHTFEVIV